MTFEITFGQIMYGVVDGIIILGGFCLLLYLISYIINWYWWKKENRNDLMYLRFFLNHREDIKKYIENSPAKKRGEL
jgi:hypothetical protein